MSWTSVESFADTCSHVAQAGPACVVYSRVTLFLILPSLSSERYDYRYVPPTCDLWDVEDQTQCFVNAKQTPN